MAATNDITGDEIKSKGPSKAYLNNYDLIWGKKKSDDNTGTDKNEYQDVLSTEDCLNTDK
jgi:hypothetical protein